MKKLFALLLVTHLACIFAPPAASAAEHSAKPAIILVHGAFADGSAWNKVISLLQKQGFTVTAVQNPLTSLSDDIATTRRAMEAQTGPVVLVGHSYGGAVITGVAEETRVKALVYIAAFAPEVGDSLSKLFGSMPPAELATALEKDSDGFLHINRDRFREVFAKDVSEKETRLMAATQKPIHSAAFETAVTQAPWKNIPSWYLVATEDKAINPDQQKFMAARIGAKTIEVKASHVPFLSHPDKVAKMIAEAAGSNGN